MEMSHITHKAKNFIDALLFYSLFWNDSGCKTMQPYNFESSIYLYREYREGAGVKRGGRGFQVLCVSRGGERMGDETTEALACSFAMVLCSKSCLEASWSCLTCK